ncbi:hypothetical protein [Streptomyces sp. CRN 30]|uniref:hypothetical protein n=1 Tax=Streptomyces sp. CRN 30 TaxID=3075613 RepID=UPI002A81A488|nr:hypothetical protein [Streptomyces sp. CRN 30]
MDLITETYLGWDPLTHTVDCPNPTWDVAEIRRTEGVRPLSTGAEQHACPNDICGHADQFARVQVRLLCRGCGTVHTLSGEALTQTCTTTATTGWGQTPTRYGDVWLWPGRPTAPGRTPSQYLVTRQAATLTRATLHGIITAYRQADGTRRWLAGVEPDDTGAHQISTLRWRHASNALDTLAEAAEWTATIADLPQRPLVVAV